MQLGRTLFAVAVLAACGHAPAWGIEEHAADSGGSVLVRVDVAPEAAESQSAPARQPTESTDEAAPQYPDGPPRQLFSPGAEAKPAAIGGGWTSPYGEACVGRPRHRGMGEPLWRESWRYRAFSISPFIGGMWGQTLVEGKVDQGSGLFGGGRLGWDFDDYWGCETRVAYGSMNLINLQNTDLLGNGQTILADFNLMYYPWGESRWRPYCSMGVGVANFDFSDSDNLHYDDVVFGLPIAIGVKYRWASWLAVRLDLADNIAFGDNGGLDTMHNVSLTAGFEARFGGSRRSYWPWNPSLTLW